MSQLQKNNGNAIIIGVIITLVAMCITGLAIYLSYKNQPVEKNPIDANEVQEDGTKDQSQKALSGTLYTDMYKHNGTTLKQDELGNYTLEGLKDKTIQSEINNALQQTIEKMKQENRIEADTLEVTLQANYADVLSIRIKGWNTQKQYIETLNYSLLTGEEIKFEELFTSKPAAGEVFRDKLYTRLMWSIYGTKDGPGPDMQNTNYAEVEEYALDIVNDYDNGKEVQFYFTENTINIIEPNKIQGENVITADYRDIEIPMPEHAERIAIYKRFLAEENLYENKIEKEEPVFCVLQEHDVFERISNHVYLAVYGPEVTNHPNKEIADKILENEKAIIKEEANQFARIIGDDFAIYAVDLDMQGNGSQVIVYRSATYIDSEYFQSKELSVGITKMWDKNIEYRGYEIPDEKIIKRDMKIMDKRYDENGIQISQVDYEVGIDNNRYVYIRRNEDGTIAGKYRTQYAEDGTIEFIQM